MNKNKRKVILYNRAIQGLLILFLISIYACHKQSEDWPLHVKDSLWVAKNAYNVESYIYEGMYHINYSIRICYPASDFIESLVGEMEKRGWGRLDYDYANPNILLNHARSPAIWGNVIDKSGKRSFLWLEDWRDTKGEVIEYALIYKVEGNNINSNTCNLEVRAIFVPKKLNPMSQ